MTAITAPSRQADSAPEQERAIPTPEHRVGWWLIAPFLLLYLVFLIGPLIYGFLISFFDTSLVRGGLSSFAGISNYAEAFGSAEFWGTMWHTTLFTLLTTPPLVVLALALAILTNRIRHAQWFFRLVFFVPYIIPVTSVTMIFGWLYAAETGLLDRWIAGLGITPPDFLGNATWAMISVALLTVWWTLGFNFVLYLAGLQEIPRDLYESASMDGAGPFSQIRTITIPLLGRTTLLVTMLQIISSLKVFDQIYLLTEGGPNFSTRPVLQYIYDVGFTNYRVGYAAAASMIYFAALLIVSGIWFYFSRRQPTRRA